MVSATLLITLLTTVTSIAFAAPAPAKSNTNNNLKKSVVHQATSFSFADPGLIFTTSDKTWRAYSTSSSHGLVPMVKSTDFKTWSQPKNVLSSVGSWATGAVWAPDVRRIKEGHFVMYSIARSTVEAAPHPHVRYLRLHHGYSDTAQRKTGPSNDHCIGIATSSSAEGPFTPLSKPLICDLANGGVIDASGFEAPGGALYILWKVDGNSAGKSTPIKIQHVGANGYDLLGEPTTLISNDSSDGGLTEAPSMVYWDGWYYLFYSTHNYNTLGYDVKYAVSQKLNAPFKKVSSFLSSGNFGTAGPGGLTAINVANKYINMAFHSDINGKSAGGGRAMWSISNLCFSKGVAKAC
uniref:Levansucrase (Sucrose 6-fructosyl transferase)) n=1 Tax=Ganoderma boninense TaxID=34458 RepID=A0A5K1JXL5_9APHY|nr:Levansucrase (EC (Beta-D-fructofuranosyl transferase) (Sucrose 6-fructosyl transferase) [Ganoderma boninense]